MKNQNTRWTIIFGYVFWPNSRYRNAFPEYPRPQMVRDEWMNLNGLWDYIVKSIDFEPIQGLTTAPSWTTGEVP